MIEDIVLVNRAPVLTLWAAVVAERMGYDREEALTLGRALAGLNAQSKGRRLGIFAERKEEEGRPRKKAGLGEELWIEMLGRAVPAKRTKEGLRAVAGDTATDPASVERYLRGKFGETLEAVRQAMQKLAASRDKKELAEVAYEMYERFRPEIAPGKRGWGQKGELNLELIRSLAR